MDDTYGEQRGFNRAPRIFDENAPISVRRHFTPFNSFDNYLSNRLLHGNSVREREIMQPHFNYLRKVSLPCDNRHIPADGVCSHFLLHGFNRVNKSAINCGVWSPDAKRLILGTENGILTLWEAETFRFERLVTTHKSAIREMVFSHLGRCLITGDHSGGITYFTPSLRNIQAIPEAHGSSPVRGMAFSPTDAKFQSSGDDSTVKIWDWETATAEHTYTEHLADVRCSDWHPFRSLVVSGSKDNTLKLWDPRQAESLASIYLHKSSIFACKFNPVNGNYIATGSKDFNVKVFDIRNMREVECYKGHNREIVTLAWHPVHDNILVSGGYNGSMIYWHTDHPGPHTIVMNAHNYSVNLLSFHPLGHLLASGANDGIVKFWCREPPGSKCEVKEFTGSRAAEAGQSNDANSGGLVIGHGPFLLDAQATTTATMNNMYVKDKETAGPGSAGVGAGAGAGHSSSGTSTGGAGSATSKATGFSASGSVSSSSSSSVVVATARSSNNDGASMDQFIPVLQETAYSQGQPRPHRDTTSYTHSSSNNTNTHSNNSSSTGGSGGSIYGPGGDATATATPHHLQYQQHQQHQQYPSVGGGSGSDSGAGAGAGSGSGSGSGKPPMHNNNSNNFYYQQQQQQQQPPPPAAYNTVGPPQAQTQSTAAAAADTSSSQPAKRSRFS